MSTAVAPSNYLRAKASTLRLALECNAIVNTKRSGDAHPGKISATWQILDKLIATSGSEFKIEKIVGVGGLGIVYKGYRLSDGQPVAIKLAADATDEEAKVLIRKEGEFIGQLNHQHIVKLIEAGETTDGQPFIALEYLEGLTMQQMLLQDGCLAPSRAININRQIAEAMDHAHQAGIVHCDIKPSNIMILNNGAGDHAVVFDFGISVSESGTDFAISYGSIAYMSPEQLFDKTATRLSDVYQIGLVIFECLMGQMPCHSRDYNPTANLSPVRQMAFELLPESLRSVIRNCLATSPEDRIDSMNSVAGQLRQIDGFACPSHITNDSDNEYKMAC